ncbi:MAG: glycoside hydrolase family 127 protein [Schleiferiaceae bacterium]|nr:glycoside hydrolase family 127 protein [Schleiferiaceae bacterium]
MISSLKKYLHNFQNLSLEKGGRELLTHEYQRYKNFSKKVENISEEDKLNAIHRAAEWFKFNQGVMSDSGFGTYYFQWGWTSSYPETTGYIIPTLIQYANNFDKPEFLAISRAALDWLLTIQKPSGGWQSGYVHQDREEVVFNTGQILRGLVSGYTQFEEQKYLDSAIKACEWLISIQDKEGSFKNHVYLNQARVYDSYVVAPMLEVYTHCGDDRIKDAAVKNIEWIISKKQNSNGWFTDCDNTIKRNHKPILHTIAYTVDGILDCALILENQKFLEAASKPADVLLDQFLSKGELAGRFDKNWKGTEKTITTGCAQISIIWEKLYQKTGEEKYKTGYERMNKNLTLYATRDIEESQNTKGALFGSFPFWGRYESFACPNWATKYMMDSLMFEVATQ